MNDNAHFETVFSTFPLFYFAMVVAGLSYITFAVMMNLIKRYQFLKKVLDGKYDLPENGDNEEEVWKKEPFLSFIKWDRKRCIIQSIVSAVFFVLIIASFIYYLLEVGTKKDLYLFVFTFSLLASFHNLIKSIHAMIDAKKMNKAIINTKKIADTIDWIMQCFLSNFTELKNGSFFQTSNSLSSFPGRSYLPSKTFFKN